MIGALAATFDREAALSIEGGGKKIKISLNSWWLNSHISLIFLLLFCIKKTETLSCLNILFWFSIIQWNLMTTVGKHSFFYLLTYYFIKHLLRHWGYKMKRDDSCFENPGFLKWRATAKQPWASQWGLAASCLISR